MRKRRCNVSIFCGFCLRRAKYRCNDLAIEEQVKLVGKFSVTNAVEARKNYDRITRKFSKLSCLQDLKKSSSRSAWAVGVFKPTDTLSNSYIISDVSKNLQKRDPYFTLSSMGNAISFDKLASRDIL